MYTTITPVPAMNRIQEPTDNALPLYIFAVIILIVGIVTFLSL